MSIHQIIAIILLILLILMFFAISIQINFQRTTGDGCSQSVSSYGVSTDDINSKNIQDVSYDFWDMARQTVSSNANNNTSASATANAASANASATANAASAKANSTSPNATQMV